MAIPEEGIEAVCNGTPHQPEEFAEHPARVRVKFVESRGVPHLALAPPSPDVTIDLSDAMNDSFPEHDHRIIPSQETGVDNPFRPDGELSREADTIVSLIKEGKPITPVRDDRVMDDGVVLNGISQTDSEVRVAAKGANGSAPKLPPAPGIVEVQHGVIVPPTDAPAVEQVVIKKKPKCHCCILQ